MKNMKLVLILLFLLCEINLFSQGIENKKENGKLTDEEITVLIKMNSPLTKSTISDSKKYSIGGTHVGGKYFLTQEPFLIEGCKAIEDMGIKNVKLWLREDPSAQYPYNSNWNLPMDATLIDVAKHPYYKAVFDMPFHVFALSIGGKTNLKSAFQKSENDFTKDEDEVYHLAKYLLTTYKNREITFILHNWEGDWLLRGGTGNQSRWSRNAGQLVNAVDGDRYTVPVPNDSLQRVEAMVKWFNARQSGVSKARAEVKNSKCKVYHAIEANKVMDSMEGIPGIANYVLPNVEVDMVSWSCYDGLDAVGLKLYKGIEYLRDNIRPTSYMQGKKVVFLGEIGIPEQRYEGLTEKKTIIDRWDAYMGVCFALDIPYIIQWELYCNEPKDENLRRVMEKRTTGEMRGFWLIRPDGTISYAGEYFEKLLQNGGKRIL
jgi:hypothetical protein